MRAILLALALACCFILTSCGGKSESEKMMEKEMKAKSETRMKLLDQYNDCVAKAKGEAEKIKECENLLEAAEKVK